MFQNVIQQLKKMLLRDFRDRAERHGYENDEAKMAQAEKIKVVSSYIIFFGGLFFLFCLVYICFLFFCPVRPLTVIIQIFIFVFPQDVFAMIDEGDAVLKEFLEWRERFAKSSCPCHSLMLFLRQRQYSPFLTLHSDEDDSLFPS